MKTRCLSMANC